MKKATIVIGANYGDEGKGLLTRYFANQALLKNSQPIIIFHNGTAQRGHTVDYDPNFRHIYHHFGSGTGDKVPTFFAETFWVHPMEFYKEWHELQNQGIFPPKCFCDLNAKVVTPFDMLIDHATEAYITKEHQEPEHGSCGYGTWCATDREPLATYTISQYISFIKEGTIDFYLEEVWNSCLLQLVRRKVDLDKIPEYNKYFTDPTIKKNTKRHFISDLQFFASKNIFCSFDGIYKIFNNFIFEGAQGLGLDVNCQNEWHTTSNTGLTNPYNMLSNKTDLQEAEVCYVTRSYVTRHGVGPMGNETKKEQINRTMFDRTNITNDFQGALRYGFPEKEKMEERINRDFVLVGGDSRFQKTLAVTHCNEFSGSNFDGTYFSKNPFSVFINK